MLQSQKQALRLRRTVLANLGLLTCIPLLTLAAYLGYASVENVTLFLYVTFMWVGHLFFVAFISLNWNLRFKDASLTTPQMMWCITGLSGLMCMVNDIRTLMLLGYVLVMAFGSFRLSMRGFQGISAYTLICYASSLYWIFNFGSQHIDLAQEFFTFFGFVFVLIGFALMGTETSHLRKILSEQHKEIKGAMSRIEELAITDELTGLYNRRHLLNILDQQGAMSNRSRYKFVVCYLDLDHFKKVNDKYGHPFGDKVLKAFAHLISDNLRDVDVGARIGGEEFVLVLADADLETAKLVCQRIADNWIKHSYEDAPDLFFTLSAGITAFKSPETIGQLLERADKLLYEAKNSGRNRIVLEHQDMQVPLDLLDANLTGSDA